MLTDTTGRERQQGPARYTLTHEVLDPRRPPPSPAGLPARQPEPPPIGAKASARIEIQARACGRCPRPGATPSSPSAPEPNEVVDPTPRPSASAASASIPIQGFFPTVSTSSCKAPTTTGTMPESASRCRFPHRVAAAAAQDHGRQRHPLGPSPRHAGLMDACDRLGVLVISEHRVMGTTPELRHGWSAWCGATATTPRSSSGPWAMKSGPSRTTSSARASRAR